MRRKLAYWLLTGSLILGGAALIGPTIVKMDTDVTYGSGKDLVFKISNRETSETNAGGIEPDNYVNNDGYVAVDAVASEFESRLKTWGVEATVNKEGYDTIRVKIRTPKNDDTQYTDLQSYLSFSGGSISCGASEDGTDEYSKAKLESWDTMFDNQTARIEYVKVSNGSVPAVVIGVNETGKDGAFATLVDYCSNHTQEADSSAGTEAKNCYLVLWANWQEGDSYAKATSSGSDADLNVRKRLIFAEPSSEAWFQESDSDKDYTEFQIIPSSAAITQDGYNPDKAGAAYQRAFYYMNLLNASSYADVGAGYDVSFAFSTVVSATSENLINLGSWTLSPSFGATALACLITLLFFVVILGAFYRTGALAIISNMVVTIMGSLLLFSYFGAQFGIGALIGSLLVAVVASFGGMYYFSKFKEQLYQGRSVKKAHAEAIKRALWPTIDAGIVSIIIGLCIYGFIPSVVGKTGLLLVLGGAIATISNLIIFRLETWFLANDESTSEKVGKIYGIMEDKVPDLVKEEKPSYFGSYAKTNFKKHSKAIGICSAVLVLASVVGLGTFMAVKGQEYNFSGVYEDSTVSYIEYRVKPSSALPINDESDLASKVINLIEYNGKTLAYNTIVKEDSTVYITKDEQTYDVHYYTVNWTSYFDPNTDYDFVVNGVSETTTLKGALLDAFTYVGLGNAMSEEGALTVGEVRTSVGQPSSSTLWLGLGLGVLFATIYMCIRYRLSRGISAGLLSIGGGLIVTGFFVLSRIPVTPLVGLAAIVTSFSLFLVSIFIFGKEKELFRDSREKNKDTIAFRSMCVETANSQAAGDVTIILMLFAFAWLFFMGFAPTTWRWIFVGALVGLVIIAIFSLCLLAPLSEAIAKGLSKINISIKPRKKEQVSGKRSAEPEEAVFIGIND